MVKIAALNVAVVRSVMGLPHPPSSTAATVGISVCVVATKGALTPGRHSVRARSHMSALMAPSPWVRLLAQAFQALLSSTWTASLWAWLGVDKREHVCSQCVQEPPRSIMLSYLSLTLCLDCINLNLLHSCSMTIVNGACKQLVRNPAPYHFDVLQTYVDYVLPMYPRYTIY